MIKEFFDRSNNKYLFIRLNFLHNSDGQKLYLQSTEINKKPKMSYLNSCHRTTAFHYKKHPGNKTNRKIRHNDPLKITVHKNIPMHRRRFKDLPNNNEKIHKNET